ncbi:MAG: LacI family transcriptional regulator [Proteobacteria bacterium]|nr:MAG: LacI family transcriptional regulator [Pseudomonadota bacterium]
MITLKDLAGRLGVAPSTVARALADHPRISSKTKKRVQRLAREMGYVPNAAAKAMRVQVGSLVGLLIPDIENNFYAQIAKAFSDVCNAGGFQLILAVSEDEPEIEERHVRALVSARCAGIAIVPTAAMTSQSITLLSSGNAAQLIRRNPALKLEWHGIDDVAALRNATRLLLDLNHRRIGLVCGDETFSSGRDRYEGFRSALEASGVAVDPVLVQRGLPRASFAESAVNRLENLEYPPTAIIAAGAGLSEGMLNAVATWSPSRRREVSLVGYGESRVYKWWGDSGLTTIELPVRRIAAELCSTLVGRAAGRETPSLPVENRLYDSHLVVRGSTRVDVKSGSVSHDMG